MRNKIIAVNAVIILICGLLSFAIVRQALVAAASSSTQLADRAKRDASGASARFQLDGLRAERWVSARARESATKDAIAKTSTVDARGNAATTVCDAIFSSAKQNLGSPPSLVMIVDTAGKTIGRNGTTQNRGEDVGAVYPNLKDAISKGASGTDVWVNKERSDQYLTSYAPIHDDQGKTIAALVLGMPLNDELSHVAESGAGNGVVLALASGDDVKVVAASPNTSDATKAMVEAAKGDIKGALTSGKLVTTQSGDAFLAADPLSGFGNGKNAALVASSPPSLIEGASAIPLPIFGVTLLGLVLVGVGGFMLGNYISTPISKLEEGLLAILNGQTDKRFELDHAELGGLAFRIDQLLNQLMGIEEDTTDAEGRVSKAPTAASFSDAMSVDRSGGGGGGGADLDPSAIAALAKEPAPQYYARLFNEYISAKKALGEATEHITAETFSQRIQGMESEATQKHGRAVRYQVQTNGREVVLLAVPLA